jgi:molybdopterin adenylyltransferase
VSLRIGVLTVSDRVSSGAMADAGGPAVEAALLSSWIVVTRAVVPDDRAAIEAILIEWADSEALDVVFTTGGTGLGPRDVTPESTAAACTRLVPGIGEAMRAAGLQSTRSALLSRALAGIRGTTLVINLPGSPNGAREGVEVVREILEHAVATIHGARH